ncbi:hypothetical protein Vadar_030253 [Vaccinium darrowii]|uniref:Uncharacterized protein n=1 Tax=Vaccinium darrowii TaxID=229202 RepID=A0ACB7YZH4_9ERIC|nr:hypothetical protein Vadar_030253 [Vaccinium darrowii]
MDDYIDEIRGYAQKLEAIGYHIDDDDLVFYALKGLPSEFRGVRSALAAKGDVLFDELATILKNEESHIHREEGVGINKVFLATSSSSQFQRANNSGVPMIQLGILGNPPAQQYFPPTKQCYHTPMYQNVQTSGPYFPVQQQFNRNSVSSGGYYNGNNSQNNQRSRGGRNTGQNSKVECQICGKTNHTALYCYHRQNLQYQPYQSQSSHQPFSQFTGSKRGPQQNWNDSNQTTGVPWSGSNQATGMPMYNAGPSRPQISVPSGGCGQIFSQPDANVVTFPQESNVTSQFVQNSSSGYAGFTPPGLGSIGQPRQGHSSGSEYLNHTVYHPASQTSVQQQSSQQTPPTNWTI